MQLASDAGAVIFPVIPAFYNARRFDREAQRLFAGVLGYWLRNHLRMCGTGRISNQLIFPLGCLLLAGHHGLTQFVFE